MVLKSNIPSAQSDVIAADVTATAAELNALDGITSTVAELNLVDGLSVSAAELEEATYTQSLASNTTSAADSLAIPVTHQYVAKTTGADAEALTLADGTAGQILIINLTTDGGGDGTLTPTTCTGFATIVFADAGDQAVLKFIDGTIGWVILGLSGVSAPPVITV